MTHSIARLLRPFYKKSRKLYFSLTTKPKGAHSPSGMTDTTCIPSMKGRKTSLEMSRVSSRTDGASHQTPLLANPRKRFLWHKKSNYSLVHDRGHVALMRDPLGLLTVVTEAPTKLYIPSEKMGARLNPTALPTSKSSFPTVTEFLQYISFSDFIRLVHLFTSSDRTGFNAWLSIMHHSDPKLRLSHIGEKLWGYFISIRSILDSIQARHFSLPKLFHHEILSSLNDKPLVVRGRFSRFQPRLHQVDEDEELPDIAHPQGPEDEIHRLNSFVATIGANAICERFSLVDEAHPDLMRFFYELSDSYISMALPYSEVLELIAEHVDILPFAFSRISEIFYRYRPDILANDYLRNAAAIRWAGVAFAQYPTFQGPDSSESESDSDEEQVFDTSDDFWLHSRCMAQLAMTQLATRFNIDVNDVDLLELLSSVHDDCLIQTYDNYPRAARVFGAIIQRPTLSQPLMAYLYAKDSESCVREALVNAWARALWEKVPSALSSIANYACDLIAGEAPEADSQGKFSWLSRNKSRSPEPSLPPSSLPDDGEFVPEFKQDVLSRINRTIRQGFALRFGHPAIPQPYFYQESLSAWNSSLRETASTTLDLVAVATTFARMTKAMLSLDIPVFLEQANVLRALRKLGKSRSHSGFYGMVMKFSRIYEQMKDSSSEATAVEKNPVSDFDFPESESDAELDWAAETSKLFDEHAKRQLNRPRTRSLDEEKSEEPPVAQTQGPFDIPILAKWKALLSAMLVPEVVSHLPGAITTTARYLENHMFTMINFHTLGATAGDFVITCAYTLKEFFASGFDLNILIGNGGLATWAMRVKDSLSPKWYQTMTINGRMEKLSELHTEALRYSKSRASEWKNNTANTYYFKELSAAIDSLKSIIDGTKPRDKPPFSLVMIGPYGIGKTTLVSSFAKFVAEIDDKRPRNSEGRREVQNNDVYDVHYSSKHWDKCKHPTILHFNDLSGSGYVNNGSSANVPDLLRTAVDTCAFFIPQAAIEDKKESTIDPKAVIVSSNDMSWNFDVFGDDWGKLLRRYKKRYYIAYPVDCYIKDIDHNGTDHGRLKNPEMNVTAETYQYCRVFECTMRHVGGRIHFQRNGKMTPLPQWLGEMKDSMSDHFASQHFSFDSIPTCIAGEALLAHIAGKCCKICDFHERPLVRGQAEARLRNSQSEVDLAATVAALRAEVSAQGPPIAPTPSCCCSQPVVDSAVDMGIESLRRRYSEMALRVCKAAAAVLGVALGAALAIKVAQNLSKPTAPMADSRGVVNPHTTELEPSLLLRYGLTDGRSMIPPAAHKIPTYPMTPAYTTASNRLTSAFDDVSRICLSNEVWLGSENSSLYGVFITPSLLVFNSHNYDLVPDRFCYGAVGNPTPLGHLTKEDGRVFRDVSSDLCWVKSPQTAFSNLKAFMMDKVAGDCEGRWADDVTTLPVSVSPVRVRYPDNSTLHFSHSFTLPRETQKGDCGRPLTLRINKNGLFGGIHMAGGSGVAYVAPITLQHLNRAESELGPSNGPLQIPKVVESQDPLHPRSKLRSAQFPGWVLGTVRANVVKRKSSFVKTEMYPAFSRHLSEEYVVPSLHVQGKHLEDGSWVAPYTHKFGGFQFYPQGLSYNELEAAVAQILAKAPTVPLTPLTLKVAISGVEGAPLLRRLNLATSAGIWGPDKKGVISTEEMSQGLYRRVLGMIEALSVGPIADHQKYAKKDEILKASKDAILKHRYFMVSDLEFLLVCRMFVAPFCQYVYSNREVFCAYGAFNALSPQFGDMMARAKRFAQAFALDVKHMDTSHRNFMAEAIAGLVASIVRKCGYNEEATRVTANCFRSLVFSLAELDGDFAVLFEGMGSGVYMTFLFNCLSILLLYIVSWNRVATACFWENVFLAIGGDDSFSSTSNSSFTGRQVAATFRDFGYEITSASKSGDVLEYEPWENMVFLKRTAKTILTLRGPVVTGALERDSILKSICFRNTYSGVPPRARDADVLDNARREMALHGRECLEWLDSELEVNDYAQSLRYRKLTFDQIIDLYLAGDLLEMLVENEYVEAVATSLQERNFLELSTAAKLPPTLDQALSTPYSRATALVQGPDIRTMSPPFNRVGGDTIPVTDNTPSSKPMVGSDTKETDQQKTVVFDMQSTLLSSSAPDPSQAFYAKPKAELSIQESLSRPVHIASLTWSSSSPVFSYPAPELLSEWIVDGLVISKLTGYKFFKGKPTIRLVVNGSTFWYGKALLAFDCLPGDDGYTGLLDSRVLSTGMKNPVQASMARHISIDPSVSQTYDIDLPFVSSTGWYNRFAHERLRPSIHSYLAVISPLASATGSPVGQVTMQMYLMMKDVELTVPAMDPDPAIAMIQAGESLDTLHNRELAAMYGVDEQLDPPNGIPAEAESQGPSSSQVNEVLSTIGWCLLLLTAIVATVRTYLAKPKTEVVVAAAQGPEETKPSSILKWASTAASVWAPLLGLGPWVSPLLGSMSAAAKSFGYASTPALLEQVSKTNHSMSHCAGTVPVDRLVSDPKQAVAISAYTAGVGEDDDMDLLKLAQRPGLLYQISWAISGMIPAAITVSPSYTGNFPGITAGWIQPLPLSQVAWMFQYWSGSLVYDFEIVASGFHRGCFAISFIPYLDAPPPDVYDYPNRFLTTIVDINQSRFASMEVPYVGDNTWSGVSTGDNYNGPSATGILAVYQLNPLITIGSTSPVTINVYVRGGKDIAFAKPTVARIQTHTSIPLVPSQGPDENTAEEPGEAPPAIIAGPTDHRFLLNFGENITTVKQLISKFSLVMARQQSSLMEGTLGFVIPTMIPAAYKDVVAHPLACQTLTDYYSWMAPCYTSLRGGQRFCVMTALGQSPDTFASPMFTYKLGGAALAGWPWLSPNQLTYADAFIPAFFGTHAGFSSDKMTLKNGPIFECPPLYPNRFLNPRKMSAWLKSPTSTSPNLPFVYCTRQQTNSSTNNESRDVLFVYRSASDDTSMHLIQYLPEVRATTLNFS